MLFYSIKIQNLIQKTMPLKKNINISFHLNKFYTKRNCYSWLDRFNAEKVCVFRNTDSNACCTLH